MRLIDADLAVEKCNEDMEAVKDLPQRQDGILDGIMNIHECPTVEPERCSDCIANGGDWECDHMHCRKGRLPSEQPTQNERVNSNNPLDCISRQDAIDAIRAFYDEFIVYDNGKSIEDLISELPSAQPEQRWTPVKSRPMDDEERKEWSEKLGYDLADDEAVIYTSQLPDDGQECIVCTEWGNVFIDTFLNDPDYGCAFEDHGDMDGITAWMPLPKPWKGERDE